MGLRIGFGWQTEHRVLSLEVPQGYNGKNNPRRLP
jgi:hypothetical protein